jgi:lambda family phage portal protein
LPNGGRIVQGVEFDAIGRRVAYWLFREHPGASWRTTGLAGSSRVPATEVEHVFRSTRAGQVRAVSWFAPVLLKMRDFDEYDDASLMKQKIAACLAVLTFDTEGTDDALGTKTDDPLVETLEPGMITRIGAGQSVEVVQPPAVNDYDKFSAVQLRAIATGLGVAYEDLTGDYAGMPYSAARMSRIRHWVRVEGWRWRMLIPRMCVPVWAWVMSAALLAGRLDPGDVGPADWTAPPMPMLDADKEIAAIVKRIRAGLISWPEAVRELGLDPDELLAEIAASNKKIDGLGLVLDCDPRVMSGQGQKHAAKAVAPDKAPAKDPPDDNADDAAASDGADAGDGGNA